MDLQPNGELVPIGGGDPIPLIRPALKVGRRESCDVCLRFPNISGEHGELVFADGLWRVNDLGSTNGVKVNGIRIQSKILCPGDEIAFANRRFTIQYQIAATVDRRALDDFDEDILSTSLLERAGLVHRRAEDTPRPTRRGEEHKRRDHGIP